MTASSAVWIRASLLLLVAQAIFWTLLIVGERLVVPDSAHPELTIEVRTDQMGGTTSVPLHPAPVYRFRDTERAPVRTFVYGFDIDSMPDLRAGIESDRNYALLVTWSRNVVAVRLAGTEIAARSSIRVRGVLSGFNPVLYDLPDDLLRSKGNVLEIDVRGRSLKILPRFFVGDKAELLQSYAWQELLSDALPSAAVFVMLFVALLCALMAWSGDERRRTRALVLLLLLWSFRNGTFFGLDEALPIAWQQPFHYLLTYLFLCSIGYFSACWTGSRFAGVWGGAAAVSVVYAAAVGAFAESRMVFSLLFPVETVLSFLVVGVAIAQLLRYGAQGGPFARYEGVLFIACLTSVAVDAADDRFDIVLPLADPVYLTFYAAPICGLLLALGSLTVLVANSQRARRSLASLNELLDSRLRAQALALEKAHEREKAMEAQRAILEERQRLTRDVHDGLGGHLVSLLMRLRRGQLSLDDAVVEVSDSLDDLRLIVSSLDQFDEPIGLALGGFRERMEPKLRAAGLTLVWELEMEASRSQLGPSRTLNLLRIVQEAVTNTLRHAQAASLAVRLRTIDHDLLLEIEDDGVGFPEEMEDAAKKTGSGSGQGLSNMRNRAAAIGATFRPASDHSGTRLTLRIPTGSSTTEAEQSSVTDDPAGATIADPGR